MDPSGNDEAIGEGITVVDLATLVPFLILALAALAVDELARLEFTAGLDLAYVAAAAFFIYGLFVERTPARHVAADQPMPTVVVPVGVDAQPTPPLVPGTTTPATSDDFIRPAKPGQSARELALRIAGLIAAIVGALAIGVAIGISRRPRAE